MSDTIKRFLTLLAALFLIAGCGSDEPVDTDESNDNIEVSQNDIETADTEESSTPDVSQNDIETTDSDDDSEADNTEPVNIATDLIGSWSGFIEFNEADRAVLLANGMPADQIDERIGQMADAKFELLLNADNSCILMSPNSSGQRMPMTSTWSSDGNLVTIIMKALDSQPSDGRSMPVDLALSNDRKTLTMRDPSGQTKSLTVFTKD